MRKPPILEKGATIDLVAPSFGCTTEPYATRLDAAIRAWKRKGFAIHEGPNVRLAEGKAASASGEDRAKEIMDAFGSDSSLILSVGGGEMMCEMLPYLDFEALKKGKPKWFMGFSDNTNLTFVLATHADMMSIYGPCAGAFYQPKWRNAEKDAFDLLSGGLHSEGYPKWSITRSNPDHPLWGYRMTQDKVITAEGYEKPFSGTLMGGCIDCLINLCGTRFDKVKEFIDDHPEGIIWYLESCDLNSLALRRAYFELKEAGWFASAKGFLLGRALSARDEIMGIDRFNAATDILGDLGAPILMDVDLGHLAPSLPIVNGAEATVSFKDGNIIIDYK